MNILAEALGIKETLPAFLSRNISNEELPTGVCFASGGSGNDDLTAKAQVYMYYTSIFTIYIMSGPSQIYIYKCYCYSIISYNMYCSTYQGVLPLSAQLEMFQNYKTKLTALVGAKRASNITSNGLYLLSSGNNDIALTYSLVASRIKFFPNYADTLVVSASNFLKVCEFLLC